MYVCVCMCVLKHKIFKNKNFLLFNILQGGKLTTKIFSKKENEN